jgi:hypothetical protein
MKLDRLEVAFGFALLMAFDTAAQLSFKLAGMHAFPPQANLQWVLRLATQPWICAWPESKSWLNRGSIGINCRTSASASNCLTKGMRKLSRLK